MRLEKILLFFVTIICFFFIANAAFAAQPEQGFGTDKGGIILSADKTASAAEGQYAGRATGTLDDVSVFPGTGNVTDRRYSLIDHSSDMFKVMSVLEKRVGDRRLRKRLEDKLPALSDTRLKLAASLSERIADDGHSAKKDFAFLLLTTLIVFS